MSTTATDAGDHTTLQEAVHSVLQEEVQATLYRTGLQSSPTSSLVTSQAAQVGQPSSAPLGKYQCIVNVRRTYNCGQPKVAPTSLVHGVIVCDEGITVTPTPDILSAYTAISIQGFVQVWCVRVIVHLHSYASRTAAMQT